MARERPDLVCFVDATSAVHFCLPVAEVTLANRTFALALWEGEGLAVLESRKDGYVLVTDEATVHSVEAEWRRVPDAAEPSLTIELEGGPARRRLHVEGGFVHAGRLSLLVVRDDAGDVLLLEVGDASMGLVVDANAARRLAEEIRAGSLSFVADPTEILAAAGGTLPLLDIEYLVEEGEPQRIIGHVDQEGRTYVLLASPGPGLPSVRLLKGRKSTRVPPHERCAVMNAWLRGQPAKASFFVPRLKRTVAIERVVQASDIVLLVANEAGERIVGMVVDGSFEEVRDPRLLKIALG